MKRYCMSSLLFISLNVCAQNATATTENNEGKPIVFVQGQPVVYHVASPFYTVKEIVWQSLKLGAGIISLGVALCETYEICRQDSWPCRAMRKRFSASWNSDFYTCCRFFALVVCPYILAPAAIRSGWQGLARIH